MPFSFSNRFKYFKRSPQIIGFILAFSITVGVLGSVPGLARDIDSESPEATNVIPDKKFHYVLVMSEDDALCKPLVKFYTDMMHAGKQMADPTWEDLHVADLEAIGVTPYSDDGIFKIKLFGESEAREVYEHNTSMGKFATPARSLIILKPGATYRSITQSNGAIIVDPTIVEHIKFEPQYGFEGFGNSHFLIKWPHFANLLNAYKQKPFVMDHGVKMPNIGNLPEINPDQQNIFQYKNQPLFLDRSQVSWLPEVIERDDSDGFIVAYRMNSPVAYDDLCYLALVPNKRLKQMGVTHG